MLKVPNRKAKEAMDTQLGSKTGRSLLDAAMRYRETEHPREVQRGDRPERCRCCRSTGFVDIAIHAGASIRRDCLDCGHFLQFMQWHGKA